MKEQSDLRNPSICGDAPCARNGLETQLTVALSSLHSAVKLLIDARYVIDSSPVPMRYGMAVFPVNVSKDIHAFLDNYFARENK